MIRELAENKNIFISNILKINKIKMAIYWRPDYIMPIKKI